MRSISLSKLALTPDISRPSAKTSAVATTAIGEPAPAPLQVAQADQPGHHADASTLLPPRAIQVERRTARPRLRLPLIGTAPAPRSAGRRARRRRSGLVAEEDRVARLAGGCSIRAAVLTASPITVKSRRPPPPTFPATTVPESMPMPISRSPWNCSRAARAISSAASRAQIGVVGQRLRARRRRPAARRRRTCRRGRRGRDDRDGQLEQAVERLRATSRGLELLGEGGEVRGCRRTSSSRRPRRAFRRRALAQDVLRDVAVEVGAERAAPDSAGRACDPSRRARSRQAGDVPARRP